VLCEVREGERKFFYVETVLRENALRLFGFLSEAEREVFKVLLDLSGVGPKVALAILSSLSFKDLSACVHADDYTPLQSVPGIGAKSAEKILVGLKSKIEKLDAISLTHSGKKKNLEYSEETLQRQGAGQDIEFELEMAPSSLSVRLDVRSALENLGYKAVQAQRVVDSIASKSPHIAANFGTLMKESLSAFQSGRA
jgi:Holliday junction DNA helicase RuvA